MKLPPWSRDWRIYAGGATIGALMWWVIASAPTIVGAPSFPVSTLDGEWVPIPLGGSVTLQKGVRYRGCVRLGILNPLRALASVGAVLSALEAKGFRDVRVASGDTPPNWPAGVDCFRYVDATWAKDDEVLDPPGALDVAWRWVPA